MKMACDEIMNIRSYISIQEDEDDDDITDEAVDDHDHDHDHSLRESHPPHNFSMCTSSCFFCGADDEDDEAENNDMRMRMYMSRLSIESFDGDVDDQFSDDHDKQLTAASDSDKEVGSYMSYSLPATPPRRRCCAAAVNQEEKEEEEEEEEEHRNRMGAKGYASENEVGDQQKMMYYSSRRTRIKRRKRVRVVRRMSSSSSRRRNKKEIMDEMEMESGSAGESTEGGGGGMTVGGGGGLMVITRPKGGRRSLCMGMEEVKACRDLGFELEHQRMLEMSSTTSFSFDTASSGANSPIANWRISSPGDDPRDVKARLKVWAQAVALASASQHST